MNIVTKLLLVDDDPIELFLLKEILTSKKEFIIYTANNAKDGFILAEQYSPDIIVSDFIMPEENGFEFCRKIKKHPKLRNTIFLLLTSIEDRDNKIEGLELGADDYLTKPYNHRELLSKIHAFIRIKNLQDELQEEKKQLSNVNKEMEESFNGIINLLHNLIEIHIPNASMRTLRATEIARWIAKKYNVSYEHLQDIHYAALLHEIGKIFASSAQALHFPIRGQSLTNQIPRLKSVAHIIRHQMENYDGTGYPDRLQKEEIPLGSQILRVINVIESLPAFSSSTELQKIIHRCKDSILDSKIVALMDEYLEYVADNHFFIDEQRTYYH